MAGGALLDDGVKGGVRGGHFLTRSGLSITSLLCPTSFRLFFFFFFFLSILIIICNFLYYITDSLKTAS